MAATVFPEMEIFFLNGCELILLELNKFIFGFLDNSVGRQK